jgi:hypothetical protein
MLVKFPQLRELVRVARAYLAGQVHVSHLGAVAGYFHEAARFLPMPPELKQRAEEWVAMTAPVLQEQNPGPNREAQLRSWIAAQLHPFEAVELPSLR